MASLNQPIWNISGLQVFMTCKSEDDFSFSKYGETSTLKYSSYLSFAVKNREKRNIMCSFSVPNFFRFKSSLSSFCVQLRNLSQQYEEMEDCTQFDPTEGFVKRTKQIVGCGSGSIRFSSFLDENSVGFDSVKVSITINEDTRNTIIISGEQMLAIEDIVTSFNIATNSILLVNTYISSKSSKGKPRSDNSHNDMEEVLL